MKNEEKIKKIIILIVIIFLVVLGIWVGSEIINLRKNNEEIQKNNQQIHNDYMENLDKMREQIYKE